MNKFTLVAGALATTRPILHDSQPMIDSSSTASRSRFEL